MYAAAGGASIASRKARQNKAQGKTSAGKKIPVKVAKPAPKHEPPQSKQFHHLPDNYHKAVESSGGLAPPNNSLHQSRSFTLRAGESDQSSLRASRSAHEIPSDPANQGLEPGVVGPVQDSQQSVIGSPPRAYSCPHWEARLLKTPTERIVGFGSADVPFAVCECAQGKAAWQEAAAGVGFAGGRRCSVAAEPAPGTHRVKQTEAHLRWMKRNRIHDLSYGGSSSDEEDMIFARAAGAVGGLLYVGLGIVALGLVISFVGTGDKGFKTYELRLAGPALIIVGLVCCFLRILLCACPVRCRPPRARARPKEPATERLLLTERPPPSQKRLSIAATALLLQNEREVQLPGLNLTVMPRSASPPSPSVATPPPVIPVVLLSQPQKQKDDSLIELQTMDGSSFDISSISSSELSVDNLTVIENANAEGPDPATVGKLAKAREPLFARRVSNIGPPGPRTVTFADTPNIIAPPSEAPPPPAEIVLTPSKLGQ